MKIDLSCPAEIRFCELPGKDHAACDLTLNNLSSRQIVSIEATVTLLDREGRIVTQTTERVRGLDGRPETLFAAAVPCACADEAVKSEAIIEKVWFGDNSVWRRSRDTLTSYTPNNLPPSRGLEALRNIAGADAVGYPSEQDLVWVCVCGRPNDSRAASCIRCHRDKDQVFHQFNREAIDKIAAQKEKQLNLRTKAARENSDRLQLIREQEYNKKKAKRKKILTAVLCVLGVLALAWGTVFHLLPYLRFRNGVDLLEKGDAAAAAEIFREIPDYRGAAEKLDDCRFILAQEDLESGEEDRLIAARDAFLSFGDREGAAALAEEAEIRRGTLLMESGRISDARAVFAALKESGSTACDELLQECDYRAADALLSSGSYEEASAAFTALGSYRDSAEMAAEAVYRPALELLNAGEYEAAAALLTTIPDHALAGDKLAEARYGQADALDAEGKITEAGEMFRLCGDLRDAAQRADDCFYRAAGIALEAGDTEAAASYYQNAAGYQDADSLYLSCMLTLASRAIDDTEYTRASELLAGLDRSDEEVQRLNNECLYQPALNALKKKDWQTAVSLLEKIPGYADADRQLLKARYGLAGQLADGDLLQEAAAQYELLGDYENSEKQLKAVRYKLAGQLLDDGDAAGAADLYEALGTYKDSAASLKTARYRLAGQKLAAGEPEEAKALYTGLKGYKDSADMLAACDYAIADRLEKDGEAEKAAELFLSIPEEQDARDRAEALCYDLAEKNLELGDKLTAADWFVKCGDRQDAAARAAELYTDYYADALVTVEDCMENGDYAVAAAMLENMRLTSLSPAYSNLPELYLEACYRAGEQLYDAGRPYEALPYFEKTAGYRNTQAITGRNCYRILGVWQTEDGSETCEFRRDGTCDLNGETLCFLVSDYDVKTGTAPDALTLTLHINYISDERLTLRPVSGKAMLLFRAAAEETADGEQTGDPDAGEESAVPDPAEEPADAEETSGEDYLVSEDQ